MDTLHIFNPGEVLIREGEAGESAYFIEDGRVEISTELDGQITHLSYAEKGEIVGEMSIIDEKPRSATVTAETKTMVKEIHRDNFVHTFTTNPDISIAVLKSLFERLRQTNIMLARHQHQQRAPSQPSDPGAQEVAVNGQPEAAPSAQFNLAIEGISEVAANSLPQNPMPIERLPFLLGRKSRDPLANNHLMIDDDKPWQISRHHLAFIREKGKFGVYDRGSTLGASVNGKRIGGHTAGPGPIFLNNEDNILIIGKEESPYRYKLIVS